MATPLIGYLSMLRLSTTTVTDPGSASGFPIANLYDFRATSQWKYNSLLSTAHIDIDTGAGGVNADYIALVNHNLHTLSATVRVLADTVSPAAVEVLAAVSPSEDTVTVKTFTAPGAKRYWRVSIAGTPFSVLPYVGEMFLGLKTSLPEYCAPSMDPFMTDAEAKGSRSEGGHFLGATLRGEVHRGVIEFGDAGLARSWFTSDGNDFISYAQQRKPFFFVLDTGDNDFDRAYYLKLPDAGRILRFAVGGSYQRFRLSVPYEEAYMEPVTT